MVGSASPELRVGGAADRSLAAVLAFLMVSLAPACFIAAPDPEGTDYLCETSPICPPGFRCVDGRCVDDVGPDAASDGAVLDAAPDGAVLDAAHPDAAAASTLVFGESDRSDITGDTRDTFLNEIVPANNWGSHPDLHADLVKPHVTLLRFDLAAIPAGSTVLEASLSLRTIDVFLTVGKVQCYELLEDWQEGTGDNTPGLANWDLRLPSTSWTAAGAGPGSRDVDVLAEIAPYEADARFDATLPAAVVQRWVDTASQNFGVVLVAIDSGAGEVKFASAEHPTASARPELTVTFSAP